MGLVSSKPEEKQCCPCPEENPLPSERVRVGGRKLKNKVNGKGKNNKKTKRSKKGRIQIDSKVKKSKAHTLRRNGKK